MLLTSNRTVAEHIVHLLASNGAMLAADLLSQIPKTVTKQSLYKELRALDSRGVIIKKGKKYSLRLSWVHALSAFSRLSARSAYMAETQSIKSIKRKQTFKFSNMQSALALWTQASFAILKESKDLRLYEYSPNAIFPYVDSESEGRFLLGLRQLDVEFRTIILGDSVADKAYIQYLESVKKTVLFGKEVKGLENRFVTSAGQYLITVVCKPAYLKKVKSAFHLTNSSQVAGFIALHKLLREGTEINISIERSATKVSLFRDHLDRILCTQLSS